MKTYYSADEIYETWRNGNLADAKEWIANHPDGAGLVAHIVQSYQGPERWAVEDFLNFILRNVEVAP